jgi:hypothetical protein
MEAPQEPKPARGHDVAVGSGVQVGDYKTQVNYFVPPNGYVYVSRVADDAEIAASLIDALARRGIAATGGQAFPRLRNQDQEWDNALVVLVVQSAHSADRIVTASDTAQAADRLVYVSLDSSPLPLVADRVVDLRAGDLARPDRVPGVGAACAPVFLPAAHAGRVASGARAPGPFSREREQGREVSPASFRDDGF